MNKEILIQAPEIYPVHYLDTTAITAHVDINRKRIEISRFLKIFPELHDFFLKHERTHARFFIEKAFIFNHIWLDYKDRFKLFSDKRLFEQFSAFQTLREPESLRMFLFMVFYNILNYPTSFFYLMGILTKIRNIRRTTKPIRKWKRRLDKWRLKHLKQKERK